MANSQKNYPPLRFARPPNFGGQKFVNYLLFLPELGEVPIGRRGLLFNVIQRVERAIAIRCHSMPSNSPTFLLVRK